MNIITTYYYITTYLLAVWVPVPEEPSGKDFFSELLIHVFLLIAKAHIINAPSTLITWISRKMGLPVKDTYQQQK